MAYLRLITFAFVLATALPVAAQSTKDKLLAVEAGLNDPSEIVRLSTMESALADESKAVREYAMRQAFAASDIGMRSLAVTHFFTTRESFTVYVSKSPEHAADEELARSRGENMEARRKSLLEYGLLDSYAPSINYVLEAFDETTGTISGFCLRKTPNIEKVFKFSGVVTGDALVFQHKCSTAGHGSCVIDLKLSESAPEFVGTLTCDASRFPAAAALKLG